MEIQVAYHSVDGYQETKFYKTLKGAQRYAQRMVGAHPEMGGNYAISGDGVSKVASNISLRELFPSPPAPPVVEMDWVCPECYSNVRCDCE